MLFNIGMAVAFRPVPVGSAIVVDKESTSVRINRYVLNVFPGCCWMKTCVPARWGWGCWCWCWCWLKMEHSGVRSGRQETQAPDREKQHTHSWRKWKTQEKDLRNRSFQKNSTHPHTLAPLIRCVLARLHTAPGYRVRAFVPFGGVFEMDGRCSNILMQPL